jgi:hypothetical protein
MAIKALRADAVLPIPVDQVAISVAAAALAAHGRASVGVGNARLLRFRNGDAVLEYTHSGGLHRTRILRRALGDPRLLEAELYRHLTSMLA